MNFNILYGLYDQDSLVLIGDYLNPFWSGVSDKRNSLLFTEGLATFFAQHDLTCSSGLCPFTEVRPDLRRTCTTHFKNLNAKYLLSIDPQGSMVEMARGWPTRKEEELKQDPRYRIFQCNYDRVGIWNEISEDSNSAAVKKAHLN